MANPYESGLSLAGSRIVGNPYTLQMGLTQEELKRVQEELLYWKFYNGDQWTFKRPDGEPQNTINYSSRFVDKGVAFLMGKGFTINVEKNAEEITKPFLDKVWDDNKRMEIAVEMAQSGGITGNAWVKVSLEEYDPDEDPMLAEIYPKGRIRITVLPSYACFPKWHPHDKDRMESIRIIYPITVIEKNEPKQVWYREEITKKEIVEYIDDRVIARRKNDIGAIYVVRIKNLIVANQSLGKSDLQDIIPLQKEFNEKTTDVSDIINYHASPVTVVYGAKTNNLEKGARKIWGGLPKDARVENLELKSDLSASMNYIELIKNAMFEIASMPEDALGGAKSAHSNTTGIALHIKNQPLIDTNNNKIITYGEGIEEINRLILRIADVYELEDFDYEAFRKLEPHEKWTTEIEFPNPLPKDELLQMQLIAQKLGQHLITRIDALKELGEYDAVSKLEEIKEEFVEWQNLMFEASPLNQGGEVDDDLDDGKHNPLGDVKKPNIQGVNRDIADLKGHTGRGHSKKGDK